MADLQQNTREFLSSNSMQTKYERIRHPPLLKIWKIPALWCPIAGSISRYLCVRCHFFRGWKIRKSLVHMMLSQLMLTLMLQNSSKIMDLQMITYWTASIGNITILFSLFFFYRMTRNRYKLGIKCLRMIAQMSIASSVWFNDLEGRSGNSLSKISM